MDKPIAGGLYYLPVGQVDVTVVRKLTNCQGETVEFDVTAEATVTYVPDLRNPLLIDYEALNAAFKKTTFNVTWYENGTLKSINGDMSDRSAAVISNIGAAGAQFAKIAARLTGVGTLDKGKLEACTREAHDHVEQAKLLRSKIKQLQEKLLDLPVDQRPPIQAQIDKAKGLLAAEEGHLTFKQTYTRLQPAFTDRLADNKTPCAAGTSWSERLKVDPAVLDTWIEQPGLAKAAVDLAVCVQGELATGNNALASAPDVYEDNVGGAPRGPLVYRQPGPIYLTLCRRGDCTAPENVISRSTQMLPQAGVRAVLPLVNGVFDSNVLKASFLPSGALASLDYITEAQAEAASATVATVAGVAREGIEDFDNAEIVKLRTRFDELKLQNELIKLRQEQDGLRN